MRNERKLLYIVVLVAITLLILSARFNPRASGKVESEGEQYQEQSFTTLNNENPIDFQKYYCDRTKQIEVHESLDFVLTCFKTYRQLENKYELELFNEEINVP